jgi:hypothetical protein
MGLYVGAPTTLDTVKREQVGSRRIATFDFVQMDHVQPIAVARVVRLTLGCTHGCPQGQPPDPAHSIDTDPHRRSLASVSRMHISTKVELLAGDMSFM